MPTKVQTLVATKKLRGPVKRHGGKHYLARRIIELFPPHQVYDEPFIGGGTVLLNKVPSEREIAADLDAPLVELWECLQDPFNAVATLAAELPYDEATFWRAEKMLASDNKGCRAIGFLVRNRFSRGGMGKDFAWSERLRGKGRPGGPIPGDVNAWETIVRELPAIGERVRRVEFGRCDALQLIPRIDGPDTLHYLDPPYCPETRTARKVYDHEMDRGQHVDLLQVAVCCKGKVAISGYRSAMYDDVLSNWNRVDFDMPNHSGQGKSKQRRTECLWMNY